MRFSSLLLLLLSGGLAGGSLVAEYTATPGTSFQHLIREPSSGVLILGATNALIRLDATNLALLERYETGPRLDSPYCSWDGRDCIKPLAGAYVGGSRKGVPSSSHPPTPNASRVPTPNVNQILVLEPGGGLLACGSLFQGICAVHDPLNLATLRLGHGEPGGQIPVAANSPNRSTLAFVGPGPDKNGDSTKVLYVGATFTYPYYRDTFPAVATRRLDTKRMLHLVDEGDVTGRSALDIRAEYRSGFRVHYVSGFAAEGYAYWTAVQKASPTQRPTTWVSKILRLCDSEKRLESYSELRLECLGPDNRHYNLIQATQVTRLPGRYLSNPGEEHDLFLLAVFAKGPDAHSPGRQSAVCMFPLRAVGAAFDNNAGRCMSGVGTRGLPHFGRDGACHNVSHLRLKPSPCQPGHLGGPIPLSRLALHIFPDALLTSVTVADVAGTAVLLFGTSDGRLKKMALEDLSTGREFGEEVLDKRGRAVDTDVLLDENHLIATIGNKVVRVGLDACGEHSTCELCAGSGDPWCGWCVLEARCARRSTCRQAGLEGAWVGDGADGQEQCLRLLSGAPEPRNASVAASPEHTLTLRLNSLPPPGDDVYQCVFGDADYVEAKFESPGSLTCPLPPLSNRPAVPHKSDHLVMPLRLWSGRTNQIFFETSFTFYDCQAHDLCTSCVESAWECSWCLLDNRCVHQTTLCTNQTRTGAGNECPHIERRPEERIRIPSGYPTPVSFTVANMIRFSGTPGLDKVECAVETGKETAVKAPGTLVDSLVSCEARSFSYTASQPRHQAILSLRAIGSKIIDKTTVELYKCELLGPDCSRCLSLEPSYGCTWCAGACRYRPQCPFDTAPEDGDPLRVCPPPTITHVSPLSGPVEGGTTIRIQGRDLGTSLADIRKRVLIAGRVPCAVTHYKPSTEIVCETAASGDELEGPVSISIGAGAKSGKSRAVFRFQEPRLTAFHPHQGPMSGGTLLTLQGQHLDSGSVREVALVGAGTLRLLCQIEEESLSQDQLKCRTKPVPHPGFTTHEMEVVVDRAVRRIGGGFRFTEDPVVEGVEPRSAFRSGGRRLLVSGRHLNTTAAPRIFLLDPVRLRESGLDQMGMPPMVSELALCTAISDTRLSCPSPPMLKHRFKRAISDEKDFYESWPIGFLMDGVSSVRNMGGSGLDLRVVPDPELRPFPGGRKLYREEGDPLILEGQRIGLAAGSEDVEVLIGDERCNVSVVGSEQVVCQPPLRQPLASDNNPLPMVRVKMGALEWELGRLAYASAGGLALAESGLLDSVTLVGALAAAAAGLLLCCVVGVAVWWRRKSCQAEKEYRRIQLQMDSLESNVRLECKQAFAELQTDMSDLTSDLLAIGIPFHPRRVYAARFLFKEDQQQTLLLDWAQSTNNGYSTSLQLALTQFESLLWNKEFVLGLVEGLESESSFSTGDRVYVASLLTAALARNMEYLTDIVITLLRKLIDKWMTSQRGSPEVLLRRSESVVEKMVANWLALCLYDQMQEEAGSALFLLLKALKHQIEKGPVDAVTGDARYSLSEERLLREQIQSEPLTLHVVQSSGTGRSRLGMGDGESVPCRVLSCDTVGQAKAKILDALFRNHPFSSRPGVADFDLEWQSPRGPVTLLDDERCGGGSPPAGGTGLKRLNTLATYRLAEQSLGQAIFVTLIARRRQSPASGNYVHPGSHPQSSAYTSMSSSSLLIPNGHHSPESWDSGASSASSGTQYWHLVPPTSLSSGGYDSGLSTLASRRGRLDSSLPPHHTTLPKSIPEIYLTRLLTSKGTVQKFVDDFFAAALRVQTPSFPIVIKYLFDFLEAEAKHHQVEDANVVQSWKNNAVHLRFWVNLIKNPEFVFDAEKTSTVDSALSVIAAAFMDACSTSEPRLGKDSPSNKLLFAKDLPRYRELVRDFYHRVRILPPVPQPQLKAHLAGLSKAYATEFNVLGCVRELLCYVVKYRDGVLSHLSDSAHSPETHLSYRLQGVLASMSGEYSPSGAGADHVYASVQ